MRAFTKLPRETPEISINCNKHCISTRTTGESWVVPSTLRGDPLGPSFRLRALLAPLEGPLSPYCCGSTAGTGAPSLVTTEVAAAASGCPVTPMVGYLVAAHSGLGEQ